MKSILDQEVQRQLKTLEEKRERLPVVLYNALRLCALGIAVIPIVKKGKKPAIKSWKEYQEQPPSMARVKEMFEGKNHGLAIVCGEASGLIALDPDDEAATKWCDENRPNTPLMVKTARGTHRYYRDPGLGPIPNKCKLKTGDTRINVDIRGSGGYCVGPGSEHATGAVYEEVTPFDQVNIEDVPFFDPAWIEETEKPQTTDTTDLIDGIEASQFSSESVAIEGLEQAIKWLKYRYPAVEGNAGDNRTYQICADMVRGFRLSDEIAIQLILKYWNPRCEPSWSEPELRKKIENARKYANGEYGYLIGREIPWDEMSDLPPLLPSVPTAPDWLCPEPLKAWVTDVCERANFPLEYALVSFIVALATVIGRRLAIHPKQVDDWLVIVNLWGVIVGHPSMKKSRAIEAGIQHLRSLADKEQDRFLKEKADLDAEMEIHKLKVESLRNAIKAALKDDEGDTDAQLSVLKGQLRELSVEGEKLKVVERRYWTNDANPAVIQAILAENPTGIAIIRDEILGWLRSMEKPGNEGDRSFYVESWNGNNPYRLDRIGRGSVSAQAICISLLGAINPDPLNEYVTETIAGGNNDGLLQRFQLMVYPDHAPPFKWVDRKRDENAYQRVKAIFAKIDESDLGLLGSSEFDSDVPAMRFDDEAQAVFEQWYTGIEIKFRGIEKQSPVLASHFAKYPSLMPSLALIFHVLDWADGKTVGNRVSAKSARLAAAWCDYLETHARKVYAGATNPEIQSAYALIDKIRSKQVTDGMTIQQIHSQHHWKKLETSEKVKSAIQVLACCGVARIEQVEKTKGERGRPSDVIRINPEVFLKSDGRDSTPSQAPVFSSSWWSQDRASAATSVENRKEARAKANCGESTPVNVVEIGLYRESTSLGEPKVPNVDDWADVLFSSGA